ncbi:unnamed protein product [Boreogadus saida]
MALLHAHSPNLANANGGGGGGGGGGAGFRSSKLVSLALGHRPHLIFPPADSQITPAAWWRYATPKLP